MSNAGVIHRVLENKQSLLDLRSTILFYLYKLCILIVSDSQRFAEGRKLEGIGMTQTHRPMPAAGRPGRLYAVHEDETRHSSPLPLRQHSVYSNWLLVARLELRGRNINYVLCETCSLRCTNFAAFKSPPHRHCRTQRVVEG